MYHPSFQYEFPLWNNGFSVIGVDEVGRGCLAGPLFVCAASIKPEILKQDLSWILDLGINDSKKISSHKRAQLKPRLEMIFDYCFGVSSVSIINRSGIVNATQNAIRFAVSKLITTTRPNRPYLLADAIYTKNIRGLESKHQSAIIHGDQISILIAAASVIAKVERDSFMDNLSCQFPAYLWDKNKGYGTLEHRQAIKDYGLTPHHRELFVRKYH